MHNGSEHAIAELTEAAALQAEIAHQRLALEWGQMVFTHVVQLWNDIEAREALAYEDKVAAQARVLDEATRNLWRLHKMLAYTRRVLQQHRRHLRQQGSSIDLSPTPSRRGRKADAKTRSRCRRARGQPIGGTKVTSPSPGRNGEHH